MADPRPTLPEAAPGEPAPTTRPSAWAKLMEDPLPAVLGAVVVVLLGFSLTVTNARISDASDRITRLEVKMDDRFAAQDEKIDELDKKIDELGLKLTALIVALEAAGVIDANISDLTTATAASHGTGRVAGTTATPSGRS